MILAIAIKIPIYVCFIASLGQKFVCCETRKKDDLFGEFYVLFEKLKASINDCSGMKMFNEERANFEIDKRLFPGQV